MTKPGPRDTLSSQDCNALQPVVAGRGLDRDEAWISTESLRLRTIQCHPWLLPLTFEECTVKIPLKTKIHLQTDSGCRHALRPYRFRRSCFGGGFLLVFFRERKLTN